MLGTLVHPLEHGQQTVEQSDQLFAAVRVTGDEASTIKRITLSSSGDTCGYCSIIC